MPKLFCRPPRVLSIALCACAAVFASLGEAGNARADEAADREFFELKIRPLLVEHCYECHSAAAPLAKGGLLLDSREGLLRGGDSGPAIVPGKPEESPLLSAVTYESFEMPPAGKLPHEAAADLEEWIRRGAFDPRDVAGDPAEAGAELWASQFARRREWWSLRPVVSPPIPQVSDAAWPATDVDRFILQKLEERNLRPAPPAERRVLARRLSFTLTGLPPAAAEVEAFLADATPEAWPRLVDRLLASPHFGERWARHWMDVVRYTDTYGYEWDIPAKGAWRYRDYLIRAFNGDVPFDQLVREQIAGDLLENPRIDEAERINESLLGPMFYQLGEKRHGDSAEFNGIHQEMLDNKIDALSKAFLATTVSCARCHNHKLDAVSQSEYYALAGTLISSRWVTNTVDLPDRQQALREELKAIKGELRPLLAAAWQTDAAAWTVETWRGGRAALAEEPPLEHPLRPWFALQTAAEGGGNVAEAWAALAKQYSDAHAARLAHNAAHFTTVADFRQGLPSGWSADGIGLLEIVPCGDFVVALGGDAAVAQVLHGGLCTSSLSPRLNGALRTPWLNTIEPGHLSFEVAGGGFAAKRTVVDNAFLTERQSYLDQKHPAWQLTDTLGAMRDRHIYIELATKSSNPNFPPRVGLGGACSEEQAADPRSWFAVSRVVRHEAPSMPQDELERFLPLLAEPACTTLDEAAARYSAWYVETIAAWAAGQPSDEQVKLLNAALDAGLLVNRIDAAGQPAIAALVERYRLTEARLREPWTVNGMADIDEGFDYRLNVRGDYDQLGEAVPRGFLQVIAEACGIEGDTASTLGEDGALGHSALAPSGLALSPCDNSEGAIAGSGRRQLAELLASPDNPLTARVYVNRVWHWLFGAGIVGTPDDFGHVGERASHPELLDYLAARFMAEGWSTKKLVREIVLGNAWRQSQAVDPAATTVDPANRLLHHFSVRRLDAESIRDSLLFVSGGLDASLYGPPINPHRLAEDPQKRLFAGPLDGDGRRSLYTKITIMEPPRFLATFNQPTPKIPTGKRDVTTTPAQSLALLNDPFVAAEAARWAAFLVARPDAAPAERIAAMFEAAYGRQPTAAETELWSAAVADFAAARGVAGEEIMGSVAVWKDVAHAAFNTKEFIYLR